jgi:hypothetical protein
MIIMCNFHPDCSIDQHQHPYRLPFLK